MDNFDFGRLRESFAYCHQTGTLIRKSNNKVMAGRDAYGYVQVGYEGKMYKAHRLIWAMVYGEFPQGSIDHINGERSDNRLVNLRVVTRQQNAHNQRKSSKRNKSGYLGVCWNQRAAKWQAGIHVGGANIYLGVFHSPEEAHAAYLVAKRIHHPSAPD